MSHKYSVSISQAACTILLIGFPCLAQIASPVKELSRAQEASVGGAGFTEIAAPGADFKTAVMVSVKTDIHGTRTKVDRSANATSAIYAGVSLPNALATPATPATSAAPPPGQIFNFKQSGDSAQGWATMSATGMPFLMTRAFGKATTSGTSTWTARVFVPVSQTNMYVRFTLPRVQVSGVNEADGPARYQSRFRAELMLNGHPVWSSEAIRLNEHNGTTGYSNNCPTSGQSDIATMFQTYGVAPYALSATDKNTWSTLNSVTLALGSFPAGQALDLSLVVRADTSVDSKCCFKNDELFCSGASATVDWDNSVAIPVRFWAGPAI
ncbi:MAG: hypothetical protein NTW28_01210 [Candidatus Solibacter sp.]|nr:hypothetical protein [Candidatus Solibacter sp.]